MTSHPSSPVPPVAATPPGAKSVEEVPASYSATSRRAPWAGDCDYCGGRLVTRYRPGWDSDCDTTLRCTGCGWES